MDFIPNPYAEILQEIEQGLWEHDFRVDEGIANAYDYDNKTFHACIKIFISGIMVKLWHATHGKPMSERQQMADDLGRDIRQAIIVYTGLDPQELVKL